MSDHTLGDAVSSSLSIAPPTAGRGASTWSGTSSRRSWRSLRRCSWR